MCVYVFDKLDRTHVCMDSDTFSGGDSLQEIVHVFLETQQQEYLLLGAGKI